MCLALSASRKGAREIHKQGLGGGGGECGRLHKGASMPVIDVALPAIFGDMRPSPDLSIVSYSFICGNKLMNQLYHLFMTTGVSQGYFSSLIATVTEGNTFTCVYRPLSVMQYIIQNNKNH